MDKPYIDKCFRWVINNLSPYYVENRLPQELSKNLDVFYRCISDKIDWFNLTEEEAIQLGFLCTDPEASSRVWFIPNWLQPLIPQGMIVTDSDGNSFEYNKETCSKELLYGCLTFGIIL